MILFEGKRIYTEFVDKSVSRSISCIPTFINHFYTDIESLVFSHFSSSFFFSGSEDLNCKLSNRISNSEKRLLKLQKITKFRKGDISLQIYIINSFLSLYYFQSTSRYALCQFSLWLAGLHLLMLLGSMAKFSAKSRYF